MARRWTAAAGACLATALLAGCSGGTQQASTTLPTTTPPTAAASPTLAPLGPPDFPVPAEARQPNAQGASAELRYYLALIGRQPELGAQPLRGLSRECTFCNDLADRMTQDASAGYKYRGGTVTVDQLGAPAIHDSLAEFTFSASQTDIAVLDRSGNPVPGRGDSAASGLRGAAALTWDPTLSVWLVTQLSFTEP